MVQTPPLAEIGGHTIELLGFTSNEPASIMLIGEDVPRHLTLHVVQPDASEEIARQALEEARVRANADVAPASRSTVARSVADVADKLARHEGLGDEQRTAQIKRWCEESARQFRRCTSPGLRSNPRRTHRAQPHDGIPRSDHVHAFSRAMRVMIASVSASRLLS